MGFNKYTPSEVFFWVYFVNVHGGDRLPPIRLRARSISFYMVGVLSIRKVPNNNEIRRKPVQDIAQFEATTIWQLCGQTLRARRVDDAHEKREQRHKASALYAAVLCADVYGAGYYCPIKFAFVCMFPL
jgi:hypothetical protein